MKSNQIINKELAGVEIFCGAGKISAALNQNGFISKKIDIRKRKGVCVPDLRIDVLKLTAAQILELCETPQLFFMWLSPPCDIWSYASGGYHLTKNFEPKTEKAKEHIKILNKSLALIEELKPTYWFIENPRGNLRYYPKMINFLVRNGGMTKELTLSSYGFPTTKPTNIFTNGHDLTFKRLESFGRGAKCNQLFDNLTKTQRQSIPAELAETIANYLQSKTKKL
jgi:site-specific DNA-cytosine methylase